MEAAPTGPVDDTPIARSLEGSPANHGLTPRSFALFAFLDRLDRLHARMPLTTAVVETMRRHARY